MSKKFLFYLKDVERAIVVTDLDHNKDIKETEDEISKLMVSSNVLVFRTKRDSLIVRPNDIRGILIQVLDNEKKKKEVVDSFDFTEDEVKSEIMNDVKETVLEEVDKSLSKGEQSD
ncbi:MAG: hypothetical protein ACTSX1_07180 [Candidatus Heimdallarchaeaceae archaeon]